MEVAIRRVREGDVEALVELTLLAFVPVFESFQSLLGPVVYPAIWPDWRRCQREAVEGLCRDDGKTVLVAEEGQRVVGFVAYEARAGQENGTVLLIAVHPVRQNRGIGTLLNLRAMEEMRALGVKMAVVETGGESSHAPARRSYEKAGYVGLPLVRYFQCLQPEADPAPAG